MVKKIRGIKEVCKAEQPEFDKVHTETDRLLMNKFISTSDEHGLERLEREFEITPIPGQGLEERRIAILIKATKKSLSFKGMLELVQVYSCEVNLDPDYNKGELNIEIGDTVNNVREVYKTLDEISGLNIYLYFTHESEILSRIVESSKKLELGTYIPACMDSGRQFAGADFGTGIKVVETFQDATVISRHDLWRLDGSVKLDGGRLLDAEEINEEI